MFHNSYTNRAKSEAIRVDRLSCIPTRVLSMANRKQVEVTYATVSMGCRKGKSDGSVTAENILNKEFVNNLIQHDAGFRILKNVRGSPAYWENSKKNLLAMIRQLGTPTIFLTLSASEKRWLELLQLLSKQLDGKNLSLKEVTIR